LMAPGSPPQRKGEVVVLSYTTVRPWPGRFSQFVCPYRTAGADCLQRERMDARRPKSGASRSSDSFRDTSSQENCAQDVGSSSFWALPRRTSRERIIRPVLDLRLQPATVRRVHTTAPHPPARRRGKTPPGSRDIGHITPRRCEAR